MVKIKFLNTGNECVVSLRCALKGKVKDNSVKFEDRKFSPSCENYNEYLKDILKGRWMRMMDRCYNTKIEEYKNYGAIGVTVCEYWKVFDNYLNSLPYIYNFNKFYYNPLEYQIDKDYLQFYIPKQYRVYSPQTCIFLSIQDNANLAVIENHKPNSFYGVKINSDNNVTTFSISFSVNGKRYSYGTYSDIIVAANEYNYYYSLYAKYELVPLFNMNIPYISHEEAQKYLIQ